MLEELGMRQHLDAVEDLKIHKATLLLMDTANDLSVWFLVGYFCYDLFCFLVLFKLLCFKKKKKEI